MAKITANISVAGTDLVAMRDEALEKLSELHSGSWTIESADLWGEEDMASKQGMLRSWRASFSATAQL